MAEMLFNRFELERKVRDDQLYTLYDAWDKETDKPVIVKAISFGGRPDEPFNPQIKRAI